jgi:hypothetical protein
MRMRASGNKVKTMWDLIKEELGTHLSSIKSTFTYTLLHCLQMHGGL